MPITVKQDGVSETYLYFEHFHEEYIQTRPKEIVEVITDNMVFEFYIVKIVNSQQETFKQFIYSLKAFYKYMNIAWLYDEVCEDRVIVAKYCTVLTDDEYIRITFSKCFESFDALSKWYELIEIDMIDLSREVHMIHSMNWHLVDWRHNSKEEYRICLDRMIDHCVQHLYTFNDPYVQMNKRFEITDSSFNTSLTSRLEPMVPSSCNIKNVYEHEVSSIFELEDKLEEPSKPVSFVIGHKIVIDREFKNELSDLLQIDVINMKNTEIIKRFNAHLKQHHLKIVRNVIVSL